MTPDSKHKSVLKGRRMADKEIHRRLIYLPPKIFPKSK